MPKIEIRQLKNLRGKLVDVEDEEVTRADLVRKQLPRLLGRLGWKSKGKRLPSFVKTYGDPEKTYRVQFKRSSIVLEVKGLRRGWTRLAWGYYKDLVWTLKNTLEGLRRCGRPTGFYLKSMQESI